MTAIGMLYAQGRGVTQNDHEAVEWYRRGAAAGDTDAMLRLGEAYDQGEGVTQDHTLSRQWLQRAAAAGNEQAEHRLSMPE